MIYSPSTWAPSMSVAFKWLSRCLDAHAKCQSSSVFGYAPTRLLHIGQPNSEKIQLSLRSQREGIVVQYATLSHCWGTSMPSKFSTLNSTSLKILREGIFISDLGQVFQDAVFTARSLGLAFLWIDSFCIFQDSRADWQREALLMNHVYSGAMVNIVASTAAGHDASCFPERDVSLVQPCIIKSAWDDCENHEYNLYHNDMMDATFKDLPLMKRAWVVQELLLAPRIVHLTGNQLFWECYELTACETYPGGLPPNIHEKWLTRDVLWNLLYSSKGDSDALVKNTAKQGVNSMRKLWKTIVDVYTTAQLTYGTDKLIALSGISKLMGLSLGDEYCAGLWRDSLVTDLFWYGPSVKGEKCSRPSPYRAPSWSWASVNGPVSVPLFLDEDLQDIKPLVNILTCEVKTATGDPFGFVTGGFLKLSGLLATIQMKLKADDEWHVLFGGIWWNDKVRLYIRLDCAPSTCRLHCLPLFLDNHQLQSWSLSCLLLEPTGVTRGQFKRAGILHAFSGAMGMQVWTNFEGNKNEKWLEYESRCEGGGYVITIL